MSKLTKEAQAEYDGLMLRLETLGKLFYLRGRIDALEGVNINLDKDVRSKKKTS